MVKLRLVVKGVRESGGRIIVEDEAYLYVHGAWVSIDSRTYRRLMRSGRVVWARFNNGVQGT